MPPALYDLDLLYKAQGNNIFNPSSQPAQVFPSDADTGGFGNTVVVSVIVDENGRVVTAHANTSVTLLDDPAVAAAYQATFEPASCNGKPVKAWRLLRYKFVSPRLAKN